MIWTKGDERSARSERLHVSFAVRYAPVFFVFALALVLRLYRLDAQSLWLDEGSTWQFVGQSWRVLLLDLLNPFSAYPLYHVLLKGWVALAGDSEWALRVPSALAGAVAVAAVYLAAQELQPRAQHRLRASIFPLTAALLVLSSPFALWYAQEAKVYSLLLLVAALLLWSLLRALRLNTRRAWLFCAAVALLGLFVHRLALLLIVAAFLPLLDGRFWLRDWRGFIKHPTGKLRHPQWYLGVLFVLGCIAVVWAMIRGLGSEGAATGAAIPAGPATALWLTFVRFSVDRGPGDVPWWWLLPWAGLLLWSLFSILGFGFWIDRQRKSKIQNPKSKMVLLSFLLVPLALFLVQLAYTRFYEPRYLMLIYPAWALALAYPSNDLFMRGEGRKATDRSGLRPSSVVRRQQADTDFSRTVLRPAAYGLLLAGALAVNAATLWQPRLGLFSGAPVKEQYREALTELARRVQPDDLVVLHPGYLRPLYNYYMQRLSSDPPPAPVSFADFWYGGKGQSAYGQREWDTERRAKFAGYLRSFLLIAPEHARTVDVPKSDDEYGLVGLYFQYSREQRKWPCGIWRMQGVHLLCQESPEAYYNGTVPQPATPMQAVFGTNLQLLGYTLKATIPTRPAVYRAGGNLPITLFWDVEQAPTSDYSMFLHLCQDCSSPPAASSDGPPLAGYLPTTSWLPGKPARDDRAIPLPRDLPPGRYKLVLGVYPFGNPAPEARLAVSGTSTFGGEQVLLGTVEIIAPE